MGKNKEAMYEEFLKGQGLIKEANDYVNLTVMANQMGVINISFGGIGYTVIPQESQIMLISVKAKGLKNKVYTIQEDKGKTVKYSDIKEVDFGRGNGLTTMLIYMKNGLCLPLSTAGKPKNNPQYMNLIKRMQDNNIEVNLKDL